jgi:hypothetical protein
MSDSDPESDQAGEMAYELPADRNRIERLHGIRGTRKGFKNKVSAEAREFCLRIVGSPLYRKRLFKAALERTLHPRIEEMLWRAAQGMTPRRLSRLRAKERAQRGICWTFLGRSC